MVILLWAIGTFIEGQVVHSLVFNQVYPLHFTHLEDLTLQIGDSPIPKGLILSLILNEPPHDPSLDFEKLDLDVFREDDVRHPIQLIFILLQELVVVCNLLVSEVSLLLFKELVRFSVECLMLG